jgi:SET domain
VTPLPTLRHLDRLPDPATRVRVAPARIGSGLFARRSFAEMEPIIRITGRVVRYELLWQRGGKFLDNCIRFGPETYLDPGDGVGRYVNHSCEPNTAIHKSRNRLFLVAARSIARGEELSFDYSTTIGDDDIWTMRCACDEAACRKRIKRFGSLPADLQHRYRAQGLVPNYILATLGWIPTR